MLKQLALLVFIVLNTVQARGGQFSEWKQVDNTYLQAQLDGYKSLVENYMGKHFAQFTAVRYSTQIVHGVNYMITFNVGNNNEILAKIWTPFPTMHNAVPFVLSATEQIGTPSNLMNLMSMPGGWTEYQTPDASLKAQLESYQPLVENYLGKRFSQFKAVKYMSQIVAGVNFNVAYDIGNNSEVVAKIFVPLPSSNAMVQVYSAQEQVGTPPQLVNLKMIPGGWNNWQTPDASLKAQFESFQHLVESFSGKKYTQFQAVRYTSQIVAGVNYNVEYNIGNNNKVVAKFFVPLPNSNQMVQVISAQEENTPSSLMNLAGGFSEWKQPDAAMAAHLEQYQTIVEGYLGKKFSQFKAVKYQQQVVAGMNYLISYDIGNFSEVVAKVFVPLPQSDAKVTVVDAVEHVGTPSGSIRKLIGGALQELKCMIYCEPNYEQIHGHKCPC